jgi:ribosomal protein L37AE/L43A
MHVHTLLQTLAHRLNPTHQIWKLASKKRPRIEMASKKEREPVEVDDTVCSICNNGYVEDGNEILLCDKCDVPVHQACYGVVKVGHTYTHTQTHTQTHTHTHTHTHTKIDTRTHT